MREITIIDLEIIFTRIIRKLKEQGISKITIETDLYNKIPTHKWSIYNKIEDNIVMGSLFDDIDSLKKMISDNKHPCTFVDFDRLASLLHIISEIENPVSG
ncbi:MAG: hypothetical protein JST34_16210 [Bacteroidetes bacterium]|nr:hypothetical protein [Bacteroidota bacterium]MBX2887998.1 hypothetical protein [Ferruginibacter sp.]